MISWVAAAAFLIAGIALLYARRTIRGTTLTATWWWCLGALAASCGVEILSPWLGDETDLSPWRYAARALLLCPGISQVGAKRPQDGPWNFVVLSLWGILALPSAEALLLNRGHTLEVQGFRSWFLLVLIVMTLANTLPTRHGMPSVLVTLAQLLLLSEYLPLGIPFGEATTSAGFALLAVSAVVFALQRPRQAAKTSLDRLWLDFRDKFGLLWGLRVQERLQAAAKMYDWPVELHWTGWTTREGQPLESELPEEAQKAILITFRGLLRRFVSNDWIEDRLRTNQT